MDLISKQNEYHASSRMSGLGFGASFNNGSGSKYGGNLSIKNNRSTQERKWVDNQASVIATDSVVINVGSKDDNNFYQNDTGKVNIEGGLIANIVNYSKNVDNEDVVNNINNVNKNKLSWLDGGNLLINAKEVTYSDINDFNFSESSGYGVSLSTKDFSDLQRSSFYPEGSFGLSLVDRANEKEQKTRATIGLGQINLADNNNSASFDDLNRNIKLTQNITKDEITSALDANIEVDLRLLSENGRSDIAGEVMNLGENLSASTQGLFKDSSLLLETSSDIIGSVPGSPIWVSRYIDENNVEIKNGQPIDHPAPNLLTGLWDKSWEEPSVGRADEGCKDAFLCKNLASDESYHLQALHYLVPGFKSFSQYHDSAMIDKKTGKEHGSAYKFFSILPYLPANYYGAVGTMIDFRNIHGIQLNNNTNLNNIVK